MANNLGALFTGIANAIRNRNGSSASYYPNQMADAILGIETKADAIAAGYADVSGVTVTTGTLLSGATAVNSSGQTISGAVVIQHYYTGSGTPSSSLGENGDIYLET